MYKSSRARTRDLLLSLDPVIAPVIPYMENNYVCLSPLSHLLYDFAQKSGYSGSYDDFKNNFGSYLSTNKLEIIFDLFANFPEIGERNKLYFDLQDKILYYWDKEYIPVNAMLIAHTILEGGEA